MSAHPHNVVWKARFDTTDAVLGLLQPHLREPLLRHMRRGTLDLAADEGAPTQEVLTTVYPPFAFVARGLFDAALYYSLNVLLAATEEMIVVTYVSIVEYERPQPAFYPSGTKNDRTLSGVTRRKRARITTEVVRRVTFDRAV